MDGHRFDSLAKTVAADGTRRSFLRGLAGGLAMLLPGTRALAVPPDGTGSKPIGKKCNKDHQCATGFCNPATGTCACVTGADCDDGNPCTYDVCGNVSHQCFHDPIPECQVCSGTGTCASGGECCAGRCCGEGGVCRTNLSGEPVCCDTCSSGELCCDLLESMFRMGYCLEPCGLCCPGGQGDCGTFENGRWDVFCVLPGISR